MTGEPASRSSCAAREGYTSDPREVIEQERLYLDESRRDRGVEGEDYCGLALSGGGVRSASFGLGVLQGLAESGLLQRFDYLSSVSGGGFIGTSLSWFLQQWARQGVANAFPLTTARPRDERLGHPSDYLRQRISYLIPSPSLNAISLVGYAIRTSLISLLSYGTLLASAMALGIRAGAFKPLCLQGMDCSGWFERATLGNSVLFVADLLAVAFVLTSLIYALATCSSGLRRRFDYALRVHVQSFMGVLLQAWVTVLLLGFLPIVYDLLEREHLHHVSAAVSGGMGIVGALYSRAAKPGSRARFSLLGTAATVLILYGLGVGAFALARWAVHTGWLPELEILIAAVVIGAGVNTNYISFHRMYRDRLMETFLPNLESVRANCWGRATDADQAPLESLCEKPNERPYHLICANVALTDSPTARFRNRGGDSFIFSRLFCGSAATGWRQSSVYMKRRRGGITIPTAMAISGAAVNPGAGSSGGGLTHRRLASTLLSLLNIRLGFWAVNPNRKDSRWFKPTFLFPGLRGGVFGGGFDERQGVVELTDGGHFDNSAVYELIRRRLRWIVVSDAGADPEFKFDDLANLIERVRVDFGVRLYFEDGKEALSGLLPQLDSEDADVKRYGLAQRGYAVGKIEYPGGAVGHLIHLKATLIKDLPHDVYSYKLTNPDFPHETTLDQFFSERQFESYRELGYRLARSAEGVIRELCAGA